MLSSAGGVSAFLLESQSALQSGSAAGWERQRSCFAVGAGEMFLLLCPCPGWWGWVPGASGWQGQVNSVPRAVGMDTWPPLLGWDWHPLGRRFWCTHPWALGVSTWPLLLLLLLWKWLGQQGQVLSAPGDADVSARPLLGGTVVLSVHWPLLLQLPLQKGGDGSVGGEPLGSQLVALYCCMLG